MNYVVKIYNSKNFGIYYLITVTFICIFLWFIFYFSHAFPSLVLNNSQIATTINSVDYHVALTQGVSSSLIALFALFSDNIVWRKISFLAVFRMQGSEYNFLMLAFLLTISVCSLYMIVPYKNYELLFVFDNLRFLWNLVLTFCYLWTYVGGIWKSPNIMHSVVLLGFGQIVRISSMFFQQNIAKIINNTGLVIVLIPVAILLYYTIKWCQSIWYTKYEDYTFEMYCCNIYLIFSWLSVVCILIVFFMNGLELWQNTNSWKRTVILYMNMMYIVGVALTQSRGARVHKDICQVY